MNDKLTFLEARVKELTEKVDNGVQLSYIVQKSIDASEQTRKINNILTVLVLMAIVTFLLGVGQILLLWGLAE